MIRRDSEVRNLSRSVRRYGGPILASTNQLLIGPEPLKSMGNVASPISNSGAQVQWTSASAPDSHHHHHRPGHARLHHHHHGHHKQDANQQNVWQMLGIRPTADMRDIDLGVIKCNGDVLGAGGYAEVYKASWRKSDVAIKAMTSRGDTHDDKALRAFWKELSVLRHLNAQPLFVQLYGVCLASRRGELRPAFVMELMDCTLRSRFSSNDDDYHYLCYLRDATAGLAALHKCNIIHRDVKPQNILLKAGRAKISDVGVARLTQNYGSVIASRAAGSPGFKPPEVCRSIHLGRIGPDYDAFSMGVTILCCMTRSMPGHFAVGCEWVDAHGRPTPETKRRADDIAKLRPRHHPLLGLIASCIDVDRQVRPTMSKICSKLDKHKTHMEDPLFVSSHVRILSTILILHTIHVMYVIVAMTPASQLTQYSLKRVS